MATPIPRVKIVPFSDGENMMLNLAIRRLAVAVEKGDVDGIYNPPTLRVIRCQGTGFNEAFDAAWREGVRATLGPSGSEVAIAPIAAAIVASIVGSVVGSIIGSKAG